MRVRWNRVLALFLAALGVTVGVIFRSEIGAEVTAISQGFVTAHPEDRMTAILVVGFLGVLLVAIVRLVVDH